MTADPAWRQQSGRARDVSGVLVRRRSTARKGIAWLVVVGVLLFVIISPMLDVLVKRMEILDLGTIVYQRAQWASTVALASWVDAAGTYQKRPLCMKRPALLVSDSSDEPVAFTGAGCPIQAGLSE